MNQIKFPAVYIGLVHFPIVNKRGEEVTSSVTNLDIHDIARTARTFGIKNYFLVTPLQAQHELIGRILGYWKQDQSNEYNPDRHDALSFIKTVDSIATAIQQIEKNEGKAPLVAITAAQIKKWDGDPQDLMKKINEEDRPVLLLFGTGWGLAPQVLEMADFHLKPLLGKAPDGYNHLSVRSAVAIYCSQLMESLPGVERKRKLEEN